MILITKAYVHNILRETEGLETIERYAILIRKIQMDIVGVDRTYTLEKWRRLLTKFDDSELQISKIRNLLHDIYLNEKDQILEKDILEITQNFEVEYGSIMSLRY